jgi:glycosyltransferase involved in cell wall biosynthesis
VTDWPLVVVGGNPYQPDYFEHLKSLADPRVIFTGPVYSDAYWALQKNAGLFVFAGEIGGIHPALVEAMAAGNAVLYLDTPANHEAARGCGVAFQHSLEDLLLKMRELLACSSKLEQMRQQAASVARQKYGWDAVVEKYESLFRLMLPTHSGPDT